MKLAKCENIYLSFCFYFTSMRFNDLIGINIVGASPLKRLKEDEIKYLENLEDKI